MNVKIKISSIFEHFHLNKKEKHINKSLNLNHKMLKNNKNNYNYTNLINIFKENKKLIFKRKLIQKNIENNEFLEEKKIKIRSILKKKIYNKKNC